MKTIAIITARGGSKRIPKKNIKKFCDKPIIAYSIEAAINSNCFDEVMVSTDSKEIAKIAKLYGAHVPFFRSEDTSNDYATTTDVLKEVITNYENKGQFFDVMCCIYPTAPFLTGDKFKKAVDMFIDSEADSLLPVVKYSFPPQRGNIIKFGRVEYWNQEYSQTRSQDLEEIYHDCGQFYLCKVSSFKNKGSIITNNTIPYYMTEMEVQDIDNITDWKLAELKYKAFIMEEN